MKNIKFLFFFSFFAVTFCALSQERHFSHFGLLEGLPQETVLCMTTDNAGVVWLGTSDGVVRYDGSSFGIPPADTTTNLDIAGYRIGALGSFNNTVLIGTGQKGLLVYHTLSETTQSIGNPRLNCTQIVPVENGFFASYLNGSVRFFDDSFNEHPLIFNTAELSNITAIAYAFGKIFIGNSEGQLFFGDWSEGNNYEIELQNFNLDAARINFLKVIDSTLFIGSSSGLYSYKEDLAEPERFDFITCEELDTTLSITDIVSAEKKVFIATDQGLFETAQDRRCFIQFKSTQKSDPFAINSDAINDLHLVGNSLLIGHITLDITEVNSPDVFRLPTKHWDLEDPSVFAIYDNGNYMFTGTSSGLVVSDSNYPKNYKIYPQYILRGIAGDKDGNIWFVTKNGAFVILSENISVENTSIIPIPISEENKKALPDKNLRNIFLDRQQNIWITTFSHGVHKFSGDLATRNFAFKRYAYGEQASKLPSPLTLSMSQDPQNNYWISTQKGLSNMSLSASGEAVFKNYDEKDGLITNGVLSSYISNNGTLWVASRKGLNKYIPETDRFISYGKRDGLSNTFVYNILEDDNEILWLTTNGGLFSFNPESEKFANYNPIDGIQSTEFNLGATFKRKDTGELYVGGIAGLNIFSPEKVASLDKESELVFTSLESKGKTIKPTEGGILTRTFSETEKITLKHDDFPVNLTFGALDFRPTKNIQYQYRLLPDDTQWNSLGDKNEILLLTLSPKSYQLQIQGISRGVPWQKDPLTLAIKVIPPWYKTTLAYLLYGLIILGFVFVYYKISLQRKLAGQEAKRLQDLDDLKSRFITNITHEFRTPLTIILGYIDSLKEQFKKKDSINSSLETIEQNSNDLLGLVNQMLDLTKLEQGTLDVNYVQSDLVAFSQYVTQSFSTIAADKEIEVQFSSEVDTLEVDFDAEKMRQILTNLISNALKFSEKKGQVSVLLSKEKDRVVIVVKDDGIGISETDLPHLFDRFFQVNNQIKVTQGTGVGLALTKELVHLMKGTITVFSQLGEGTSFTVKLPITNEAEKNKLQYETLPVSIGKTAVPEMEVVHSHNQGAYEILIVEDNPDMARYINSCLSHLYLIFHASNGAEGLEKAIKNTPDLILTDVMMPILDGFEFTKKLQEHEETNHIPIVMLTSKAMHEDRLEGIASGVDVYLTKPFSKKELQLRIDKLIEKRKKLQQRYRIGTVIQDIRLNKNVKDKNIAFLNKAVEIIHKNIEDSEFNSELLAVELALSDSQLYRKLKAISNTSTAIFIRKVRLEKAKEMLQTTDKTISEIAYATGFRDPNWFGKAFKKEFDKSPSEIRN